MKIINHCYHRNGISGVGFYAIEFKYLENGKERHAIGTVSSDDIKAIRDGTPYDPETRILMLGEDGGVDIEETMRGDHFHNQLCKFIMEKQK